MGLFDGFIHINATTTSNPHNTVLGYCSRTHDYKELVESPKNQPSLGFCFNQTCERSKSIDLKEKHPKTGMSKTIGYKRHFYPDFNIETNNSRVNCKKCRHTLFWTTKYKSYCAHQFSSQIFATHVSNEHAKNEKLDFHKIPRMKVWKKKLEDPKEKKETAPKPKPKFSPAPDDEGGGWN